VTLFWLIVRARPLIGFLVLLSVLSAAAAVAPSLQRPDDEVPTAAPVTPVFSLRRVAGPVTRTAAGQRLRSDLDGILALPAYEDAQDETCLAVRDPAGRPVYDRLTTQPLIPASTMKVVTGGVVLDKLGADTRYVTPVRALSPPQDGAVSDLWLVGSGDPLLATADVAAISGWLDSPRPATSIEALADRIVNAGVRRVERLFGDESRYDTQRYLPTWEPTYATDPHVGPQSALTVNGGYAQWRPFRIPAAAPATNAATVLAGLLRARGVTVGVVGEGKAPDAGVTVAQIESLPMSDVVGYMVRDSDNLGAELMVKELGVRFGGAGTTAAGLGVLKAGAAAMGLTVDPLTVADGSGLDRGDRLTCAVLQGVLRRSGDRGALAQAMPVAGQTGTLIRRFLDTPAVGKVRAKTGSLNGVVGLTGWVTAGDGSLEFSLIANDIPSESAGNVLQDRVVSALASYPRAPAPEEIGPAPVRPGPG
jgi:D-alanyl-D-alanine carboxypeptidase/D-alanyl-D-alanine-endopeptidase (penicillin-binding protein 4)